MRLAIVAAASAVFSVSGAFAAFTAGNLVVFQAVERTANTTGQLIEVNATTPGQAITPSNTYVIPNSATASDGLRFSGSAATTGFLSLSNDRTTVNFAGVVTTNTTNNANTILTRGVGAFDYNGTYSRPATYTATNVTGNQARSATTLNDSTYFIGDTGGLYTNGSTSPSPAGNFRNVRAFGGTVYAASGTIGTVSAPSGGTFTPLTGVTTDANLNDFYLISSGENGSLLDVLYTIANDGSSGGQTSSIISKYSLVAGSWTSNGTYNTNQFAANTQGGFALAAQDDGNGADLFITGGNGATSANRLVRAFDSAGFNAAISITAANNVTLLTTATGTTLKGLDFAPVALPEPAALASVGLLGAVAARRRRRV